MVKFGIKCALLLAILLSKLNAFGFWVAYDNMEAVICGNDDPEDQIALGPLWIVESELDDWKMSTDYGKDPRVYIYAPQGFVFSSAGAAVVTGSSHIKIENGLNPSVQSGGGKSWVRIRVDINNVSETVFDGIIVTGLVLKRKASNTGPVGCAQLEVIKRIKNDNNPTDTPIDDIGCFSIVDPSVLLTADKPILNNKITICENEPITFYATPKNGIYAGSKNIILEKNQINEVKPEGQPILGLTEGFYTVYGNVSILNCGTESSEPIELTVRKPPTMALKEDITVTFDYDDDNTYNLFEYFDPIFFDDAKFTYYVSGVGVTPIDETTFEIVPSNFPVADNYTIDFIARYKNGQGCPDTIKQEIAISDGILNLKPTYCVVDVTTEITVFTNQITSSSYKFKGLKIEVDGNDVTNDYLSFANDYQPGQGENPRYTLNILQMFTDLNNDKFKVSIMTDIVPNSYCSQYCNPLHLYYNQATCNNYNGSCTPSDIDYVYNSYYSNIVEVADGEGEINYSQLPPYCVATNMDLVLSGNQSDKAFQAKAIVNGNEIDIDLDPENDQIYILNPSDFKYKDLLAQYNADYLDLEITYFYNVGTCTGKSLDIVRIYNNPPPPTITPVSYCVGDVMQPLFVENQLENSIINWYEGFPDQNNLPQNHLAEGDSILPVLNNNINKQYTFHATQTVSGCESTPAIFYVEFEALPNATLKPLDVKVYCNNNEVKDMSPIIPDGFQGNGISTFDYLILKSKEIVFSDTLVNYTFNPSLYPIGKYDLIFKYLSNGGCGGIDQVEIEIVDSSPTIQFEFEDPCFGQSVSFINTSQIEDDEVISWKWDFDGQNINTSNEKNPSYTYTQPGVYPVTLEVLTAGYCTSTVTKYVSIFTVQELTSSNTYFEDFNDADHGWISSGQTQRGQYYSWSLMNPKGQHINLPESSNWCFITYNADTKSHNDNENSWVESPCFILDALQAPMLSFKYNMAVQKDVDGAVLQYTLDNGSTWQVLGDLDEGVHWYDVKGINTSPGEQTSVGLGWSRVGDSTWYEAKFNLDQVKQEVLKIGPGTNIRFRFAFSADGFTPSDLIVEGFAFDDFFIGERKKMVLIEHFSNIYETKQTNYIQNFVDGQQGMVHISYFIDHPGYANHPDYQSFYEDDPFYLFNTAANSARSLYYGVGDLERTIVDGKYNDIEPFSAGWAESVFIERSLSEAPFTIELTQNSAQNVTVVITAAPTINKKQLDNALNVQAILVQDQVNLGSDAYHHVMRKILPNPAGTSFSGAWLNEGKYRQETIQYEIDTEGLPTGDYSLILYVQDEQTKEIYQGAFLSLSSLAASKTSKILYANSSAPPGQVERQVFPNPTNGWLHINNQGKELLNWKIYNMQGIEVLQGHSNKPLINIDLSKYSQGTYLLQYASDQGQFTQKISLAW